MNKVLKLKFMNPEGKTNTITIRNPKLDLSEEVVRVAMNEIFAADAFQLGGITAYARVIGASYYASQANAIFDEKKDIAK